MQLGGTSLSAPARLAPAFVAVVAAVALGIAALGIGACGSDDGGEGDAATDAGPADQAIDTQAELDVATFDLAVDRGPAPDTAPALESNMGEGCARDVDCKPGSPLCLTVDRKRNIGLCSAECQPDDVETQLKNEDTCPEGFLCSEFRFGEEVSRYCLELCTPSLTKNPCPASSKVSCHPVSTRFTGFSQTVCFFAACAGDKDCPVMDGKVCVSDGDCADLASDAFCEPEARRCARPGNCTAGGLCGPHALGNDEAKVGDPCLADSDCPGNGVCLVETVEAGQTFYRNGYCSVRFCAANMPEFDCPAGSSCHKLFYGGLCHKNCGLDDASTCRGNASDVGADYECYAWNNLFIGGDAVTAQPVCQSAGGQRCGSLGSQLTCANLGVDKTNETNMRCRDPLTGADLAEGDAKGLCLDDTASGPFAGAPPTDGGGDAAPDAGTDAAVDAAVDASEAVDAAVDASEAGAGADASDAGIADASVSADA